MNDASATSEDRKSTRLNSSHANSSYAVFCLKKKKRRSRKTDPNTRSKAQRTHRSGGSRRNVRRRRPPQLIESQRTRTETRTIFFFFNDTATTEIYTLSLHDALPISRQYRRGGSHQARHRGDGGAADRGDRKSTRLNSSHANNSYAVFCLNKTQALLKEALKKNKHDNLYEQASTPCKL